MEGSWLILTVGGLFAGILAGMLGIDGEFIIRLPIEFIFLGVRPSRLVRDVSRRSYLLEIVI